MEDESSSSSASSSTPPHTPSLQISITGDAENNENMSEEPSLEKPISITLSPGSSLVVSTGGSSLRKPFRQMGGVSPSSSLSSTSSRSLKVKSQLQKRNSSGDRRIKCVLIGDSKTGKSTLVRNFLYGQSCTPDYLPTLQDNHMYTTSRNRNKDTPAQADVEKMENDDENEKKNEITLQICDTGGQDDMDRLRPLCYSNAQMIIICFSVMNPTSFSNVTMKWLPEVKRHCMVSEDPDNPLKLLLVGTQSDLRSNVNYLLKLMDDGLAPVSEAQALRLANKIGALKYVESSSLNKNNVNHIFELAMAYGNGKFHPKQLLGLPVETGFHERILPNITERKLLFWRRWRVRQNKTSNKMKRLVLLPCMF